MVTCGTLLLAALALAKQPPIWVPLATLALVRLPLPLGLLGLVRLVARALVLTLPAPPSTPTQSLTSTAAAAVAVAAIKALATRQAALALRRATLML